MSIRIMNKKGGLHDNNITLIGYARRYLCTGVGAHVRVCVCGGCFLFLCVKHNFRLIGYPEKPYRSIHCNHTNNVVTMFLHTGITSNQCPSIPHLSFLMIRMAMNNESNCIVQRHAVTHRKRAHTFSALVL